jgi:DDE superfamily endonuclease
MENQGLSREQVNNGVAIVDHLNEARADRAADFAAMESSDDSGTEVESSDEELENPVMMSFYNQGGDATLKKMSNFTLRELRSLWRQVEPSISAHWSVGRGRRTRFRPMDVLFMVIVTLKYGSQWDASALIFNTKAGTFQKMISTFIDALSMAFYSLFVVRARREFTMKNMASTGQRFRNFPCARYATDTRFQMGNRPSGNLQEAKRHYSGKHSLYGFKQEVSVLPNGQAIAVSPHYPGSINDLVIFEKRAHIHTLMLRKARAEETIVDEGNRAEDYPGYWAVLCDKGYQGALATTRVLHPKKKGQNAHLPMCDVIINRQISADRIIVENYFGRLCELWGCCATKYRWSESTYDKVTMFCCALTNFHISYYPLRASDSEHYQQYRRELRAITRSIASRRQSRQALYRQRRELALHPLTVREMLGLDDRSDANDQSDRSDHSDGERHVESDDQVSEAETFENI